MNERFSEKCPVIFDWFNFARDELFFNVAGTGLNAEIFGSEATVTVANELEFEMINNDIYEAVKTKATFSGAICRICDEDFNNQAEKVYIFRECAHLFCKECLHQSFTSSITSGNLQFIRCLEEDCLSAVPHSDL